MKYRARLLLILTVTLCIAATAAAEFRFPMPEFASGYKYPSMHTPLPEVSMEWWDVVVLFATLSMAALLVLKRRSRREIFLLTMFSLVYFGYLRKGCVCSVGALQNVAATFIQVT